MKIALIALYTDYSLSIQHIYHHLLGNGIEPHLIFFKEYSGRETKIPTEKDYNVLIKTIKEINPEIIGISTLTFTFEISQEIIRRLRKVTKATIVLGGIHAIIRPEECIKYADVVCIFEGEEALLNLSKKKDIIPNLWIKKGKTVIKNRIEPIENLDNISLPDFNSNNFYYLEDGKITKGKWRLPKNGYAIMSGRGCPYSCSYCINEILQRKSGGKFIRFRSVDNIIEELKLVKKHYDVKRIVFEESIMCLNLEWLKEFRDKYKKNIDLPFWCQLHFSTATKEIINILKDAGCDTFSLGLESASERFREEVYDKHFSDKKVIDVISLLRESKVNFQINLITSNPLETDKDLKQGINLLLKLRPLKLRTFYLINFPESRLTKMILKEKLIGREDTNFEDSLPYRLINNQAFNTDRGTYWFYIFNLITTQIPNFFISFLTDDFFIKHPKILMPLFKIGHRLLKHNSQSKNDL